MTGPLAPRVVVAQWGHSVARVQKVQRVRPAFGRLVQRVAVAADAADHKKPARFLRHFDRSEAE